MNPKTTIFLALVVVACGLVWTFTPKDRKSDEDKASDEEAASTSRYVFEPQLNADDMVKAVLEQPDQPKLVFERSAEKDKTTKRPEDWRMVEPSPGASETWVVDGIVRKIAGLQYNRSFKPGDAGGISAKDAGLDPPQALWSITDKAGKESRLEIGKKAAMSNDTYVRVAGADEIRVTSLDFSTDLKRKPNEYRAKALFKLPRNDAAHVRIQSEGTAYDLTKNAAGEWMLNEPAKAYASADKVRALVNGLANLRVEDYLDDPPDSPAALGFDQPYVKIEVTTEEHKPVIPDSQPTDTQPVEPRIETTTRNFALLVGAFADIAKTKRYVKTPDQPWVAIATKESVDPLVPKYAELRDPAVTRVTAADVSRIELTTGEASATLNNPGDGQWRGEGDLANLDRDALAEFLSAFEDLKAVDFVDQPESPAKYGLDDPRAVLKVTTNKSVEPVTLKIGSNTPSDMNTFVQVEGQPGVLVVTAQQAARLTIDPMALRSRAIFDAQPEQIRKIEVTRGERRVALVRPNDEWRVTQPAGAPADPAGSREIANDLARLRAKRVVGKGDGAAYGLTQPAATIRFTIEKPAAGPPASQPADSQPADSQPASQPAGPAETSEHTLVIGHGDKGTFAKKDSEPYIFELDDTVYRVLTGELLKRGLFDFEGKAIESIRVESNAGTVEFARDDDKWTYTPDPSVKLNPKTVSDFATELAGLRVDQYIAWEAEDAAAGMQSAVTVHLKLRDHAPVTLKVDQAKRGELPRKAVWVEQKRVFLMRPADAEKLIRGLDAYVKPDAPPAPPPGQGPGPVPPKLPGQP